MSREYDKNELIHPGERLDDLQTGGYYLIQDPSRFCFGIDAVLLSSFARVKRGEKALDLGTGTGVIPILLESKNQGAFYGGLEIQEASADMARRSVQYNDLEQKIEIKTGDIKEAAALYGAASFEVITVNPPYMIGEHGLKNDNEKWVANVQNIVGPVDTIIFAHGHDIGDWHDYSDSNEKYQYFKSAGYNFFCNVDGSQPYWVQIREHYVRQGRRFGGKTRWKS